MARNGLARVGRLIVAGSAAGLLVAGCASGADSDGGEETVSSFDELQEGMINVEDDAGTPVSGGTLSMAMYSEPKSLDPAETITAVTTGGVELVNIYGALMRYNAEQGTFEPQLAEQLDHNDDYTEWNLTLRPDVEFSDGTPLDAAAVESSQRRYADKDGPDAGLWTDSVAEVHAVDSRTVVYTLTAPWTNFPDLLTTGPGMIVAPASDGADGDFTPIGAGPFVLGDWTQGTSITLNGNDRYWGDGPYLDGLEFLYFNSVETSADSMRTGDIDATYLRDPDRITDVLEDGTRGYVNLASGQHAIAINATEGRPGSDVRVRKAIQEAIDPQQFIDREYGGHGFGSSTLYSKYSRWHTKSEGLEYDTEAARRLVSAAKEDGYSGEIEFLSPSDSTSKSGAIAVQGMLDAAGFDTRIEFVNSINDLIRKVAVDQDYDITSWGLGFHDSNPSRMMSKMDSSGTQVYGMYTSDTMDGLLSAFKEGTSVEEKNDALNRIQEQVNDDVPFAVIGPSWEFVVWNDDVHGATGTTNSMVLFNDAWKS